MYPVAPFAMDSLSGLECTTGLLCYTLKCYALRNIA